MISSPVEAHMTEYLYQKASIAGIPLSGTFELTPLCNMNCKMCYVRLDKESQQSIAPLRTAEEWLRLAQSAKQSGMLYLLLTGGEPFTHPQFREILEGLHRLGLVISINSNGTAIDENTVQWMKDCSPSQINITLYGASNDTYARLCQNPNGFSQATRAVRLLKQAGIPVKLNCSLTPYNTDNLFDIFQFARSNEVNLNVATYMFPPLRRDASMAGHNDRLSPEEAARYSALCDYLILGKERFLSKGCDLTLPGEPDDACSSVGEGIRCRAGKCSFWITWTGDMSPCGMIPGSENCNVFERPFEDVWQSVHQAAAEIRLPAKCSGCSMAKTCRACAAMVYTESGNYHQIPDYRCKMTKAYPRQYQLLVRQIEEELI